MEDSEIKDYLYIHPGKDSWGLLKEGGFTKIVDADHILDVKVGYTLYKTSECLNIRILPYHNPSPYVAIVKDCKCVAKGVYIAWSLSR